MTESKHNNAPQRSLSWEILGPGEGGPAVFPAVSPHDARVFVLRSDMSGCYLTTDGGESWRTFGLRSGVCAFAFDPSDPNVMYAGTVALWRSSDLGRSWRMIFPDPGRNTVDSFDGDHSHLTFTTDEPAFPVAGYHVAILAIAIDPADSRRILIAYNPLPAKNQGAVLLGTADGGRTWTRLHEFGKERIFSIHFSSGSAGRRFCVLAETGVYLSENDKWTKLLAQNGERFSAAAIGTSSPLSLGRGRPEGPGEGGGRSPCPTPSPLPLSQGRGVEETIVYAISAPPGGRGRPVVSRDGGASWEEASGLDGSAVWKSIACCANDAATAYMGFESPRPDGPAASGIARTRDAGRTWEVVLGEQGRPAGNMQTGWFEQWLDRSPHAAFDGPRDLAVAPNDPDTCYATGMWRTYATTDGGANWRQLYSTEVKPGRWANRGMTMVNTYSVCFDPFDRERLLVATANLGVLQSDDRGRSWAITNAGLPGPWRRAAYSFAYDPAVMGLVWGGFASVHDLPRPKMWRARNPDTYEGGVAVSHDGGTTWQPSSAGMEPAAITHVLLDPNSPPGNRTLYACGLGRGVYKSVDNGRSWAKANTGLPANQPFAWRISQSPTGRLYLVLARRSEDGSIGNDGDGALYESSDGAATWHKLPLPEGCNGPAGLAIDPRDENRLYLAAWGRYRKGGDIGGGVYRSSDRGRNWTLVLDKFQHVYDVTIDPRNPRILYACGFECSAWRSADGGDTWQPIAGYTFKWGHRVIPDPADPQRIYITTYGGGIWHGPAKGDPAAPKDTFFQIGKAT